MTASMSSSIRWRATTPKSGIDVQLVSRNNEVLATRKTDATGHVLFEAGLASGEGGRRAGAARRHRSQAATTPFSA